MLKFYKRFWLLIILCSSINFLQAQSDAALQLIKPTDGFVYDIRYASSNNFLEQPFYECAVCYLKPEVAKALKEANNYLKEQCYKIILFDCFRPVSAQKKMWKAFPDPHYVANPYTKGSVHSRGAAVDCSLVYLDGSLVDMGTDHDYFGREAHTDHQDLPKEVLHNRKILQEAMRKAEFSTIRTEWWHFDYKNGYSYPVLEDDLPCE